MSVGRLSTGAGLSAGALVVPVSPASVSVGSGSATVSGNGQISFSGASSVSVNNCFTATYNNYRIIFNPTASVGTDSSLNFRYRAGGSDISTATYGSQRIVSFGTNTVSSANLTGNTMHPLSLITASYADVYYSVIEVHNPFLSRKKVFRTDINSLGSGGPTFYLETHGGYNDTVTSFDGFSIFTGGTSITGTIRVYGYANGA